MEMVNGIEGSPDRSSSPTPFHGFSPEQDVRKEVSKGPETLAVRVSQPRTTKSRASLVWQKAVAIKEEPIDEEPQTNKTVVKEKIGISTLTKQKSVKLTKSTEKEVMKPVKVEKDGKEIAANTIEENESSYKKPDYFKTENLPSTSESGELSQQLNSSQKKRRRKFKITNKQGFKCNQCGRVYKYIRGMRQHQKLECNVEPQFPCPYCPNKFRYRQGIRDHVRTHHNQAFPKWYATHYVIPMLKQDKTSP